jgi:hypothetical protein
LNVTKSFADCDSIAEEYVKYCYYGMGRHIASHTFQNVKANIQLCQMGQEQYHVDCHVGATMTVTNNRGVDGGLVYCKALSKQFKDACYNTLGIWMRMLYSNPEDREEQCKKVESKEYFEMCVNPKDLTHYNFPL